jgi:hypothetical protein
LAFEVLYLSCRIHAIFSAVELGSSDGNRVRTNTSFLTLDFATHFFRPIFPFSVKDLRRASARKLLSKTLVFSESVTLPNPTPPAYFPADDLQLQPRQYGKIVICLTQCYFAISNGFYTTQVFGLNSAFPNKCCLYPFQIILDRPVPPGKGFPRPLLMLNAKYQS